MNRAAEDDVNDRVAPGEPSSALERRADDIAQSSTGSAWLNANLALRLKGRHGESLSLEMTVGATIVGIVALLAWLGM